MAGSMWTPDRHAPEPHNSVEGICVLEHDRFPLLQLRGPNLDLLFLLTDLKCLDASAC